MVRTLAARTRTASDDLGSLDRRHEGLEGDKNDQ
jgi:hypothetical protein